MFTLSETYRHKLSQALNLAWPIIIGQLGTVLMGFFDTIQVGALGSEYIAASGFANNVYWLVNLLALGILFGVSPLVSEAFGEKNEWKAIGVFRSGIIVAAALAVLFSIGTWFFTQHIYLFKQDEIVNLPAQKYLRILNLSTVAMLMFSVCKQLFDGMGRTRVGMMVNLGGLLMNICLNWVLIYGNLGAPKLGIEGAAIATSITRVSMMLFMFGCIAYDKQIADLRIAYTRLQTQGKTYIKQILTIGIPAGLQFFFEVAAFSITQMMSGWLGVMFLASHQIAIGLASITFMVLTGISSAGTIMTGYAYGAKDKEDARVAGNTIFMLTIALEIVFAIVFLAGHKLLPLLYTNDAELIKVTATLLLFAAFFQISDGLQSAAAGVLRGIQDVKIPSAIAFISYWLIMIPSSYYLGFHTSLGINGLWLGFIIGLTVAAVALMWRFWWKVKRIEFEEL